MTNEEAKIIIGNIPINGDECYSIPEYQQAKAMAINALEQEPCDDCISRHTVFTMIFDNKSYFKHNLAPGFFADKIMDLPPVTPQPTRWIPVSERLPEEFKSVLVCYKSQGGVAQCVSERLVNMDGSSRWSSMCGQEPIAWMPLPEPYKAESEDKE